MTTLDPALSHTLSTPDGAFSIIARADGAVLASGWTASVDALLARIAPALRPTAVHEGHMSAADAVTAYYDGDVTAIDGVAVAQSGGEFRMRGWAELRRIAPGHPRSYTEFAAAIGRPTAVRAAASVCATNAPALFVPCHRVLRTDGSVGGFAWGVDVKLSLLAREAAALR
ncbi:methylated-DNA--[protein]-cysteine S-methyltransferase [Mycetocola manganoxydans]|uniref:Methylated-DNA--[protein]-cysteine S-methyltransferase n=1 Tax=Mycetocola manganoxydans TaxID=699879 RepID=A0A3L6ZIJ1_9MICO|nr:methylated-DNA--[protein]-cysteine S-methyltransferase [Mycetocola manganoxydans]RLP67856.1 methylated-DNA--[protein]-cysteine S-methyltransferase [Mycetocola manganoxydans]GHD51407.1 putative methylated-DNA:protein-cysteine methyltransferase [Mycetocola manganoxydans]